MDDERQQLLPHDRSALDPAIAQQRQEQAMSRLGRGDTDGFLDLFEAITRWTWIGNMKRALHLLYFGEEFASTFTQPERDNVRHQLRELGIWALRYDLSRGHHKRFPGAYRLRRYPYRPWRY